MSRASASLKAGVGPLKSRRAMLDTLLKHLDMVRFSIAFSIVVLVGCSGLITDPNGSSLSPEQRIAQQKWLDEALPVFRSTCASCHAGSTPNVGFLVGSTDMAIRDTLLGFDPQVVNIDAPESSRVLTKMAHNGPALLADQASAILEWIQAEHDAAGSTGSGVAIIQTAPFTPLLCPPPGTNCTTNHVDLTPAGLAGAEIDFIAQPLSADTYVTDLVLKAAADGAYIEHPLFVSVPPMGDVYPDSIDRFFNVKLNLMPTTSDQIGGGNAVFSGFTPPTGPLPTGNGYQWYITFKVVDKYRADMAGSGSGSDPGATGCKVLAQFKSQVIPVMAQTLPGEGNNCAACHMGQNGNATSAMNITGINAADDATIQTACNQVRTRINFQNIPQSGLLLAPLNGGDGAHPFKLNNYNAFSGPITAWANAEATAP